jgi:hypothetical protein
MTPEVGWLFQGSHLTFVRGCFPAC